jgi:HSP20 family protein
MAERTTGITAREGQRIAQRDPVGPTANPARMLARLADEMDRLFDDFSVGSGWLSPRWGGSWLGKPSRGSSANLWIPDIEVQQRNNEVIVRADLPGLNKEDVKVDITDDAITLRGERRVDAQHEQDGIYRSERSYGSFQRVIPLPEGAMTDQAKATFKDGVLEITMPAPPEQVTRGRRLEIK